MFSIHNKYIVIMNTRVTAPLQFMGSCPCKSSQLLPHQKRLPCQKNGMFRQMRCKNASNSTTSALVQIATNIKATGVPLLDELMQLSVPTATAKSIVLITRTLVISSIGWIALGAIHARLCATERSNFRPIPTTIISFTKPSLVLLPYYTLARVSTILSALLDVTACKMKSDFDLLTYGNSDLVVSIVKRVTQFLQDTSESVAITLVAWSLVRLKDRVFKAFRLKILETEGGNEHSSLTRLTDGVSSSVSWLIWVSALGIALGAYGIDLRPLFTTLGASSIVVGLAAQSILANIVSGIALYTTPSFICGDQIELRSTSGAVILTGVVQAIAPTRTIIRSDDGALVYVNNADLTKMLVKNESQKVTVMSS